jgi:hypothetical protein
MGPQQVSAGEGTGGTQAGMNISIEALGIAHK